jgi:eukaryotic-like serine/threonine-protein kinase
LDKCRKNGALENYSNLAQAGSVNVPDEILFHRPFKYRLIRVLGSGACGETVHVRDDEIGCDFVIKKFRPFFDEGVDPAFYADLLSRFKEEARLLFKLNHRNVVRVFNFFNYPERKTAFILMEYINGLHILNYIKDNPFNTEKVFEDIVDAFSHLEEKGILHRDVRPENIIVDESGVPKIIDFGFGKLREGHGSDELKSISLNWWCEQPAEFKRGIYNNKTDLYFCGKIFESAIRSFDISEFKYMSIVKRMCHEEPAERQVSFAEIRDFMNQGRFSELSFSEVEREHYKNFSEALYEALAAFPSGTRFERDTTTVVSRLEDLYKRIMLEDYLEGVNKIIGVFISGNYTYYKNNCISTKRIKNFLEMIRGLSEEKRSIVIENIIMKLSAKEQKDSSFEDEIPF